MQLRTPSRILTHPLTQLSWISTVIFAPRIQWPSSFISWAFLTYPEIKCLGQKALGTWCTYCDSIPYNTSIIHLQRTACIQSTVLTATFGSPDNTCNKFFNEYKVSDWSWKLKDTKVILTFSLTYVVWNSWELFESQVHLHEKHFVIPNWMCQLKYCSLLNSNMVFWYLFKIIIDFIVSLHKVSQFYLC
jgi:hypothetical protein